MITNPSPTDPRATRVVDRVRLAAAVPAELVDVLRAFAAALLAEIDPLPAPPPPRCALCQRAEPEIGGAHCAACAGHLGDRAVNVTCPGCGSPFSVPAWEAEQAQDEGLKCTWCRRAEAERDEKAARRAAWSSAGVITS